MTISYLDPWTILQHGAYVAFAFGVLLFGALAFRQILDNLELRRKLSGEDLLLLYSAPGVILSLCGVLATVGVAMVCYRIEPPTVFRYALPLIGGVLMTQIMLRLHFQRTRVRTLALVVRPIVRPGPIVIQYSDMTGVELIGSTLWTTVRVLHAHGEPVAFRIFTFQRARLEQRLRQSSTATILSKTPVNSR
ncbi:MAG: hypothetical protein FGM33_05175 [Candidatus Kapabacteria bacterium]|nr:hypothetical protein [Candidatus Kapabacteria bacterium]